jgi:Lon protease-like protein
LSESHEIPLFPLGTVLFPGMSLPLHIFEERYKLMIQRCIDKQQAFGVVMIREGHEVGPGAVISDVGTTATITHAEKLPDGRLNIATLGHRRFKVLSVRTDEPYLVGTVEDFPLQNTEHPLNQKIAARLGPLLTDYLQIFASLGNVEFEIDSLPDSPLMLAYMVAIIMRTPMKDKQELLTIPNLPSMLRMEYRMLHRESQILKLLIANGDRWRDDSGPFSVN